jgi:lysine-N-methylase
VRVALEGLTARYLTRFACLGSACEETCCRGWRIPVEEAQYQRLAAAIAAPELEAAVERQPDGQVHLRLVRDGSCAFLDAERLCSVQRRHGPELLPRVCDTYPRALARAGGREEGWASLSCPEIARQVLLHDDALDLVAAPPWPARWQAGRALAEPPTPYERSLDGVRGAAFRLLSLRAQPIGVRLFLLAYLGQETRPFFRRDAATVDDARLATVIAHVEAPATIARWRAELATLPPPRALTANLVEQLARAAAAQPETSLSPLVGATLAGYPPLDAGDPAAVRALWEEHARRRQRWEAAFPGRLALYFENHAKNFWMREWYTSSVDLLAHARRLLVRVAVLRFLLFGHPALADGTPAQDRLDAAAVEVFYKLARASEHQESFLDRIAATVTGQGMQTFAHSTFLALI